MTEDTRKRTEALATIVTAVADAIREMGPAGMVSGHLYAALSDKLSLSAFQAIVGFLKKNGMIRESNHVLYWTEWVD